MPENKNISDTEVVTSTNQPFNHHLHVCAFILAVVAIISSAFHFWPFANRKIWQMLCLPNLAVMVWMVIVVGYFLYKKGRWREDYILPHLSVFAYIAINILSIAFAANSGRAANFTIKLTLIMIGGYILFSSAIMGKISLRVFYVLATTAVTISVTYCFLARFVFGSEGFGFFDSPYKYGTYTGILVPLSVSYLFMRPNLFGWLFAAFLVLGGIITSGSMGGYAAIVIGMLVMIVIIKKWSAKFIILGCLLSGIGLTILIHDNPTISLLRNDIKLLDADGINLKQRYIEWQAEINLLEERTITGTAAGSVNDYRSNFYYRLPKLNTLKPFDQNGWLAIGAETGLLGLLCFCWIAVYYFHMGYSQLTIAGKTYSDTAYKYAATNFVGLIAAFIANIFSSVHYNGVLIIFVLVLVLVSRTNMLFGERLNENRHNY